MSKTGDLARIAGVVSDQCSAQTRRGSPCSALLGSNVCQFHGGRQPDCSLRIRRASELDRNVGESGVAG